MSEVNSDLLDKDLQSVMGKDRCQNEWAVPKKNAEPKKMWKDEQYPSCLGTAADNKEHSKALAGEWKEVPTYAPNWFDRLKGCAKYMLLSGALVAVFWYWNFSGQMDSSAAIPCMVVCGTLGGFKVGSVCQSK